MNISSLRMKRKKKRFHMKNKSQGKQGQEHDASICKDIPEDEPLVKNNQKLADQNDDPQQYFIMFNFIENITSLTFQITQKLSKWNKI